MKNIYYKVADRTQESMQAFEKRYELVSEQDIRKVFDFHKYTVESLERSESWGTSHVVYYVKIQGRESRLVFRSNAGKKGGFMSPELVMLSEKIVTDSVRALGVATNQILHVNVSRTDFPFDYQIQEELLGVDPEKYIDSQGKFLGQQQDYDKLSFELGQAIGKYSQLEFEGYGLFDEDKLHGILMGKKREQKNSLQGVHASFYEYITTNLSEHLSSIIQGGYIDAEFSKKIINLFADHESLINDSPSALVHHDLADHNLMYDPKTIKLSGIFDWEAMVLGDPLLDVASSPTWATHYPRREKLLEGYKSIRELPDDYEVRILLYELRTWIWKAKFALDMSWNEYAGSWSGEIMRVTQLLQNSS